MGGSAPNEDLAKAFLDLERQWLEAASRLDDLSASLTLAVKILDADTENLRRRY
jgi:hypothetical protein